MAAPRGFLPGMETDLPAEYNRFLSANNVSRFGKYPIKEVYATSRIKDDWQLFGNKSSFIIFLSGKTYEACVNSATSGHRRAGITGIKPVHRFLFVFPCNSSSSSENIFLFLPMFLTFSPKHLHLLCQYFKHWTPSGG